MMDLRHKLGTNALALLLQSIKFNDTSDAPSKWMVNRDRVACSTKDAEVSRKASHPTRPTDRQHASAID